MSTVPWSAVSHAGERQQALRPASAWLGDASANGKWSWSFREPGGHERCLGLVDKLLQGSEAQRAVLVQGRGRDLGVVTSMLW